MARLFTLSSTTDTITIGFIPTKLSSTLRVKEDRFELTCDNNDQFGESYRLMTFSTILSSLITQCTLDYRPKGKFEKIKEQARDGIIQKWLGGAFLKKSCQMLSKAFKVEWLKLLERADPKIIELERALIRATGPTSKVWTFNKAKLYYDRALEESWGYEDCIHYIPATQYFANVCRIHADRPVQPQYVNWEEGDAQIYHYNNDGDNWLDWYAPQGKSYSCLNKTLMSIKCPLPFDLMCKLREIKLKRPITTNLELKVFLNVLAFAQVEFTRILYRSDKKDIFKLVKMWNKIRPTEKIDLRRKRMDGPLGYLSDYLREHNYNGTLVGLFKRSYEWHERLARDRQIEKRERDLKWIEEHKIELSKQTKPPPFELVKLDPSIKFLDTVQAIYDESALMGHCVYSYRGQAINGSSYLFHIERGEDKATLELTQDLSVNQCKGLANRENKAVKWAKQYFVNFVNKWKKKLS